MLSPLQCQESPHQIRFSQKNSNTMSSVNAKDPMGASTEEPELPGDSAGLVSLPPTAVVGAPATPAGASAIVLGGKAEGERAAKIEK